MGLQRLASDIQRFSSRRAEMLFAEVGIIRHQGGGNEVVADLHQPTVLRFPVFPLNKKKRRNLRISQWRGHVLFNLHVTLLIAYQYFF